MYRFTDNNDVSGTVAMKSIDSGVASGMIPRRPFPRRIPSKDRIMSGMWEVAHLKMGHQYDR